MSFLDKNWCIWLKFLVQVKKNYVLNLKLKNFFYLCQNVRVKGIFELICTYSFYIKL